MPVGVNRRGQADGRDKPARKAAPVDDGMRHEPARAVQARLERLYLLELEMRDGRLADGRVQIRVNECTELVEQRRGFGGRGRHMERRAVIVRAGTVLARAHLCARLRSEAAKPQHRVDVEHGLRGKRRARAHRAVNHAERHLVIDGLDGRLAVFLVIKIERVEGGDPVGRIGTVKRQERLDLENRGQAGPTTFDPHRGNGLQAGKHPVQRAAHLATLRSVLEPHECGLRARKPRLHIGPQTWKPLIEIDWRKQLAHPP